MDSNPSNEQNLIPLFLTEEERASLIEKLGLPENVVARLRFAKAQKGRVTVRMPFGEVAVLLAALVSFMENCGDEREIGRWKRLWLQLEGIAAVFDDEMDEDGVFEDIGDFGEDLDKDVEELLRNGNGELQEILGRFLDEFMFEPNSDMEGLTPLQAALLASSDLSSPDSAIQLNEKLELSDIENVPQFVNARRFLQSLSSSNGTKATAAGNLNRRFVAEMMEAMDIDEITIETAKFNNKVINETDLMPVHVTRILLDVSKLIRETKGRFKATKKGRGLLVDSKAGELYCLLFRTLFQEISLDYLHGGPENPYLQFTIGYTFYMLQALATDWVCLTDIANKLLSPMALNEIPDDPLIDFAIFQIDVCILGPLEQFGLIERRDLPTDDPDRTIYEFRVSKLFDKFIQFHLDDGTADLAALH